LRIRKFLKGRLSQLWLKANDEHIEASWAEALTLVDQFDENEQGYLEGLAMIRAALTGRIPNGSRAN
jgi:hypothetical protein